MENIKHILNEDYDCFDIGAGGGTFAKIISPKVSSVECLEIADFLTEEIKRQGFKTFTNDFMKQDFDKQYDIVFAWHVLEHVLDINEFVEKAKSIAKKYIVLEIPSERKLPKMYDGHLHMFNKKSLEIFLGKHFTKFEVVDGVQAPALFAIIDLE